MSRQRSKARSLAVQAIYQWQMAGQNVADIIAHLLAEQGGKQIDSEYFRDLVMGVTSNLTRLDDGLRPHLDRSIESIDPVERAVLRLGAYELISHPEIPYRVVINEAIEMAKIFGAEQGHRYVNGVLDKAAKDLRPLELAAKPTS